MAVRSIINHPIGRDNQNNFVEKRLCFLYYHKYSLMHLMWACADASASFDVRGSLTDFHMTRRLGQFHQQRCSEIQRHALTCRHVEAGVLCRWTGIWTTTSRTQSGLMLRKERVILHGKLLDDLSSYLKSEETSIPKIRSTNLSSGYRALSAGSRA